MGMEVKINFAAIHIRAKEAGLDREAYCALLYRIAGVRTSKELDASNYEKVMRAMDGMIREKKRLRARRKKSPAEAKLWAVWYNELCPLLQPHQRNVHYLAGIIEKRISRNILSGDDLLTSLLDSSELHASIEAVKNAANSRKSIQRGTAQDHASADPTFSTYAVDPSPILNEYGNDLCTHPELADVPF